MSRAREACVLVALLTLMVPAGRVGAQQPDSAWGEPVNLSRSGAASQPRIVAGPDGRLQAFWWNRFDGVMTTIFDGEQWSTPASTALVTATPAGDGEIILSPINAMPAVVADGRGWVHALWIGETARGTGATPLLRSQMAFGGPAWPTADNLVESVAAFDVAQTPEGGLVMAYVRRLHSEQFPAGVYVKTTSGGGSEWSAPAIVYDTVYFRTMTAEDAHLRIAAGPNGAIQLAWEDPYTEQALYAYSADSGATWSEPESLGRPEDHPARPRAFTLSNGGALRTWEADGMGGCTLHQQLAQVDERGVLTWTAPHPALDGLTACPQGGESSWSRTEALLWLWGQGTGSLTLAAWDVQSEQWSEPRRFGFSFDDPRTGRRIALGDLHATFEGDTGIAIGVDADGGDVWIAHGRLDALDLAFAPPSPWSGPAQLSEEGVVAGWPSVVLDAEGNAHFVWSQSTTRDSPGTTLAYARWDASTRRITPPVEIVRGSLDEDMVRQPALAADNQGLLHLVWSGGARGEILYSRAKTTEAASAGGWASPQPLPMAAATGSWPQIGVDPSGGLVVVYAVPLNEARGVYVARSTDAGETWSGPDIVFDAEAAGWSMVDQPALAVAPDGGLHVAWLEGAVPGTWDSRGIYYVLSRDGTAWSDPYQAAGPDHEWVRIVVAGGRVHLTYSETGGGVWHRSAPLEKADKVAGWAAAARVAGLEGVGGPLGVVADGSGVIHLVGGRAEEGILVYSTWDGERWVPQMGTSLGAAVEGVAGVSSATRPEGGRLAIVARALVDGELEPASVTLFSEREIERATVSPLPAHAATPASESQATPAAAAEGTGEPPTVVPSATPDLSSVPQASGSSQLPLIVGGGLGAIAVVGLLAGWSVWQRRR